MITREEFKEINEALFFVGQLTPSKRERMHELAGKLMDTLVPLWIREELEM